MSSAEADTTAAAAAASPPSSATDMLPTLAMQARERREAAELNCAAEEMQYLECQKNNRFWHMIPMTGFSNPNCQLPRRKHEQCVTIQLAMMKVMGHTGGLDPRLDAVIVERCDELFQKFDPQAADEALAEFAREKEKLTQSSAQRRMSNLWGLWR